MVVSEVMERHLGDTDTIVMNQLRKGCIQEMLGCEAKTEFDVFKDKDRKDKIATAVEESSCIARLCCTGCHHYTMEVKELDGNEIISVDRPFTCPMGGCKCCLYQTMTVSSAGTKLGEIVEDCWYCVPHFTVTDAGDQVIYKLSPPTCLGGMCVNCCAEGNPCGKGCCKASIRIYDPDNVTDGNELGKILKVPKSFMTEMVSDADRFEVDFPKEASVEQKGILMGATIFMNTLFFEENQNDDG